MTPRSPFDLTRGLADVRADDAAVPALADATDYARERIQFGRTIGSFQALKHILADRFVDAEMSLSVSRLAVDSAVHAERDRTVAAEAAQRLALARFYCADRFVAVAADDIQVHGGMGFTAECRAHLYRRRAASNRYLFDTADAAKRAYTDTVAGPEENR